MAGGADGLRPWDGVGRVGPAGDDDSGDDDFNGAAPGAGTGLPVGVEVIGAETGAREEVLVDAPQPARAIATTTGQSLTTSL